MLIPELCEQETDVTSGCMSIRGRLISLFQGRRGSWLLKIKNIWDWCSFVVKMTQVMEWTWVQFNQSTIFQVLYWSISISQISTFLNLFISWIWQKNQKHADNRPRGDDRVTQEWVLHFWFPHLDFQVLFYDLKYFWLIDWLRKRIQPVTSQKSWKTPCMLQQQL